MSCSFCILIDRYFIICICLCCIVVRASRCRSPVVCTTNPSGDHTYSLTDDQIQEALLLSPSSSSVDEDYNFMSDVDDFDFDEDDDDDEEEDMDSCLSDVKTGKGVVEDARSRSTSEENQSRDEKVTAIKKVVVHRKNNIVTRSMTSRLRRKCPEVEDEEKKTREGADALLGLAGLVCRLNVVQQVSASAKMKGSKKRTGLRIRLRKRSCRKTSPRTRSTTCNNSYNNSNNDNKNGNRKSNSRRNNSRIGNNNEIRSNNNNNVKNDVDEGTVQVKLEAEDYLFVKVKEERIDDE